MKKGGAVYIMANRNNTVFYTGSSSNLVKRAWQHKKKLVEGFTKKYNIIKLVYYEVFDSIEEVIKRERYIKGKSRKFKKDLVESKNPTYKDLYKEIL
jgi:putative endonuclease